MRHASGLGLLGLTAASLFGGVAGADPASIRFGGGDGTTRETAVVITGAQNEMEGIDAEAAWIAKVHPGWRKGSQALINAGGRSFDRIAYDASDGPHVVWFDISGFFGRF